MANFGGKKILYLFDSGDWNSRFPVALEAKNRGYHTAVCVIGKNHPNPDGFEIRTIEKKHHALGIMAFLDFVRQIYSIIKSEKPDILHTVTLKYAFICAIAALPFPGMRKIFTLAGLGYLFHSDKKKSAFLRFFLLPVFSFLFKRPHTTLIFQNPDDLNMMVQKKCVKEKNAVLIRGSGVDLSRFDPTSATLYPPLVLMPTRLVHEKGISVFIEAARILKSRGVNAVFKIAGGETSHNPRAVSRADMLAMVSCGTVEWLGHIADMPALLSTAHIIVYPSYYGEGIPRVLLESCAAGRAIVTTDHTGCREAVSHNVNGLLVPVKHAVETANAIEFILNNPQRREEMEKHSRRKAEEEFDIRLIARKTVDVYF